MIGKFIVIEGGDGAGKDTQIDLLRKEFGEEKFLFVKDPGSTDIGKQLREIVLYDKHTAPSTEFLIYLAARAQMVEEKVKPALKAGTHVVSNRFDLSTIAYQIYGRERTELLSFFRQVSDFACGGLRPDMLVYLNCLPDIGLQRAAASGEQTDRFEEEKLTFHKRVHDGYKKHLPEYSHAVIDATQPIEAVYADVRTVIKGLL